MKTPVFVGIDVSKAQLNLAVRPEGSLALPYDEAGIAQVVKHLQPLAPTLIVLELVQSPAFTTIVLLVPEPPPRPR